jgi:CheY-like chemotaxis protein
VSDTGTGMSEAVRARACEPFFSTKGARGTGLGMSEVEGVMRRHGGRIDIESTLGVGTTVRLVLPSFDAVAAGRLVDTTVPCRARRVLLVGPHGEGLEMMRTLLADEGHEVAHAATAADATPLLCSDASELAEMPYDVLVIDLGLAGGGGWELIAAGRTRWPALRIGVVSGWEVQSRMGTSQTVDFMLRKPLRASDLIAYVGSGA